MSLDVLRAGLTELQTLEAYTSNILQKHTSTHRGTDTHTHHTHTIAIARTHTHTRGGWGHETVDEEIFADALTRPKLTWGRLRSSEIAAYRRGVAVVKPPPGLAFPPYGRRLWGSFPPLCETPVWRVMCGV